MASSQPQSVLIPSVPPQNRPFLITNSRPGSITALRLFFWGFGILVASVQAWIFRYEVSADSISYFDMSDGVLRGGDWHRLINGMYSALYPFLLGGFRRTFDISPGNEIPAAHFFGVILFIFAFLCFEFFLSALVRNLEDRTNIFGQSMAAVRVPKWAFVAVAYSVFLWSAIEHISLMIPRADMLLSGFIYLAAGLLLRMSHQPARWKNYIVLGVVLGIGILAKEAMLPLGILILASTFFLVENWKPALKMAPVAAVLMFSIGCLYFVPLSLQRGRFTLGEAGRSVYTVNVDQASPHWYLQSTGSAKGSFLHPPQKIFSNPPAYAFPFPMRVTEPLRYDQSYWLAGVRPHVALSREMAAIKMSARTFGKLFRQLGVVLGMILVLALLARKQIVPALLQAWSIWLLGLIGCSMYAVIVVEPRYVTAFLTLFCLGIMVGLPVPAGFSDKVAKLAVVVVVASILGPMALHLRRNYAPHVNDSFEAAQALEGLGVHAGDTVARISPSNADLTVERILRVELVAEVDKDRSAEFWSAPFATQQAVLRAFAAQGVKAVIATAPVLTDENRLEWTRLGSTHYWAWRPGQP